MNLSKKTRRRGWLLAYIAAALTQGYLLFEAYRGQEYLHAIIFAFLMGGILGLGWAQNLLYCWRDTLLLWEKTLTDLTYLSDQYDVLREELDDVQ